MCLGIPGRVTEIYSERDMRMGKVDFGGIAKRVCLEHTPHVRPGQYVIVHVGFALQVVDEQEAQQVFTFLEKMDELGELHADAAEEPAGPQVAGTAPSTKGNA